MGLFLICYISMSYKDFKNLVNPFHILAEGEGGGGVGRDNLNFLLFVIFKYITYHFNSSKSKYIN